MVPQDLGIYEDCSAGPNVRFGAEDKETPAVIFMALAVANTRNDYLDQKSVDDKIRLTV